MEQTPAVDQSKLATAGIILFVLADFEQTVPVKISEFKTLYGDMNVKELSTATQYRGGMAIYSCKQQDKTAMFIGHKYLQSYLEGVAVGAVECELIAADIPELSASDVKSLVVQAERHNLMLLLATSPDLPDSE